MKKLLLMTGILFISSTIYGAPYVKNLHKKCLSKHQDCTLICASSLSKQITEDNISLEALKCAEQCVSEYRTCESNLAAMRRLNEKTSFTLEDGRQYKPKSFDGEIIE